MQEHNINLSVARAKAVYDYLTEEGIIPERMTYNGYGATRMLYPDARSEDKMKQNRRVEIDLPLGVEVVKRRREIEACIDWMREICSSAEKSQIESCNNALRWLRLQY